MLSKAAIPVMAFCLAWPGWIRAQSLAPEFLEYLRRSRPFDSLKERNRLRITLPGPYGNASAAFLSQDTLWLYTFGRLCVVSVNPCRGCSFYEELLARIPLPRKSDSAPPILGIGYNETFSREWLGAVAAYPDGKAYRWSLDLSIGRIASVRVDSFSLAGTGEPVFVHSGPVVEGYRETAFTIVKSFGPHYWIDRIGLLHGLPDQNWGFLCLGQGWLGRKNGWISQIVDRGDGLPSRMRDAGHPFSAPIHLIDSSGALSREGHFALREGSAWRAFPIPAGDYSGFRVIRDWRGVGVELHAKDRPDTQYVFLQDGPTVFAIRIGNGAPAPQSQMKYQGSDSMQAVIDLKDPEGNFGSVVVRKIRDRDTSILLSRLATPAAPWGCLGTCPQGNPPSLSIRLSPDSLALTLPVLRGYFVHPAYCIEGIYEEKRENHTRVQPWRPGDTLELVSNGDRYAFIYESSSSTRRSEAVSNPLPRRVRILPHEALGRRFPKGRTRGLK